jgi:hypothetical protein
LYLQHSLCIYYYLIYFWLSCIVQSTFPDMFHIHISMDKCWINEMYVCVCTYVHTYVCNVYTSLTSSYSTKQFFMLLYVSATYCSPLAVQNNHTWSKLCVQMPWVFRASKQEILNAARCLETAFYILMLYVLMLYMYLNLNNVVTLHINCCRKLVCVYLLLADAQHTAHVCVIWAPWQQLQYVAKTCSSIKYCSVK